MVFLAQKLFQTTLFDSKQLGPQIQTPLGSAHDLKRRSWISRQSDSHGDHRVLTPVLVDLENHPLQYRGVQTFVAIRAFEGDCRRATPHTQLGRRCDSIFCQRG
jgi:hypothetical protein